MRELGIRTTSLNEVEYRQPQNDYQNVDTHEECALKFIKAKDKNQIPNYLAAIFIYLARI